MAEHSNFNNWKKRKPLMERKRRARINKSLNELQQILTDTECIPKNSKLEKADILELTVQYLRKVKEQNEYSQENKENLDNLLLERYIIGYKTCIEEVNTVLTHSQDLDKGIKNKIINYLCGCLEKIKNFNQELKPKLFNTIKGSNNPGGIFTFKNYSKLLDENNEIILSNSIHHGNLILLLSSRLKENGVDFKKNEMWRPWSNMNQTKKDVTSWFSRIIQKVKIQKYRVIKIFDCNF